MQEWLAAGVVALALVLLALRLRQSLRPKCGPGCSCGTKDSCAVKSFQQPGGPAPAAKA